MCPPGCLFDNEGNDDVVFLRANSFSRVVDTYFFVELLLDRLMGLDCGLMSTNMRRLDVNDCWNRNQFSIGYRLWIRSRFVYTMCMSHCMSRI